MARSSSSRRAGRRGGRERQPLPKGFGTIWTTVAVDLIGFGIVLPILPQYAAALRGHRHGDRAARRRRYSLAQLVFSPIWGRLSDRIGRKPVLIISLFGTAIGSLLTGAGRGHPAAVPRPDHRRRLRRQRVGGPGGGVRRRRARRPGPADGPARGRVRASASSLGPAIGAHRRAVGAARPVLHRRRHRLRERAASPSAGCPRRARPPSDTAPRASSHRRSGRTSPSARPSSSGPAPSTVPNPGARSRRLPIESRPGGRVDRAGIVRLITVSFVGMIAFSGFEATFSLLTEQRFGLKLSGTGAVFTVIGLALVVVQVGIIGRVNARLGESGTLRIGLACNAAGLALLAVDGGWATLVPALALLVLGQGLITPTLSSAVAGRAGGERGTWLGWQQSAGGLARVVGPILAGLLFQHIGFGAPYVVGAVLVALALSLVPSVHRPCRRPSRGSRRRALSRVGAVLPSDVTERVTYAPSCADRPAPRSWEPAMSDISFQLNEDQLTIQKWVHDFAEDVHPPGGRRVGRAGGVPVADRRGGGQDRPLRPRLHGQRAARRPDRADAAGRHRGAVLGRRRHRPGHHGLAAWPPPASSATAPPSSSSSGCPSATARPTTCSSARSA